MDKRLISHGEQVAYIVYKLLIKSNMKSKEKIRNYYMAALLHDIGAYKTEEIDKMVQFETNDVWDHSIYGYVFLKILSPLKEESEAVLYHHLNYNKAVKENYSKIGQLIHIADRFAVLRSINVPNIIERIEKKSGESFAPEHVEWLKELVEQEQLEEQLDKKCYLSELVHIFNETPFTKEEQQQYLKMIACSIDFRSPHTVRHTITIVSISEQLAKRMHLEQNMIYEISLGALLHDLGKIAIPVEILESEGKLSKEEMEIMKKHVIYTENILKGCINDTVLQIAIRHHEKLDGTGYAYGLTKDDLTISERIVAVADIVSALSGVRSYKASYDKEKIISILIQLRESGKICPIVTNQMINEYEDIMECVSKNCEQTLIEYDSIWRQYEILKKQYQD